MLITQTFYLLTGNISLLSQLLRNPLIITKFLQAFDILPKLKHRGFLPSTAQHRLPVADMPLAVGDAPPTRYLNLQRLTIFFKNSKSFTFAKQKNTLGVFSANNQILLLFNQHS